MRVEIVVLISMVVNGTNRFHHCKQYFRIDKPDNIYVEARENSELYLLLGNPSSQALRVSLSPDNLRLFGAENVTIPFDSKLHLRLSYVAPRLKGVIKLRGDGFNKQIILASQTELKRAGINVTTAEWIYPNPFPADGHQQPVAVGTEEYLEKQFSKLVDISRYDVSGDLSFARGRKHSKTSEKAGYVYILTHPTFHGWVKIGSTGDLTKRLSVYQTSDPLRRFELRRFYMVDDCAAVEKWVLHHLSAVLHCQGEWVNCSASVAIRFVEEALDLVQIGEQND